MWLLRCLQEIHGEELRAANTGLEMIGLPGTLTRIFPGKLRSRVRMKLAKSNTCPILVCGDWKLLLCARCFSCIMLWAMGRWDGSGLCFLPVVIQQFFITVPVTLHKKAVFLVREMDFEYSLLYARESMFFACYHL